MTILGPDDLIVAVILMVTMLRRLGAITIRREDNPHVTDADFATWRSQALSNYNRLAVACVLKVIASALWAVSVLNILAISDPKPALVIGGLTIFAVWVVVAVMTWRPLTWVRVRSRQDSLPGPSCSPPRHSSCCHAPQYPKLLQRSTTRRRLRAGSSGSPNSSSASSQPSARGSRKPFPCWSRHWPKPRLGATQTPSTWLI